MSDPHQPQGQQPPYQPQPYQPPNQPYQPYQPYQAGPPAPYGQAYPPAAMEHPKANTVLILGIVGVFVPIVSFVAWVMGNGVVKEIRSSGITYSNEQYATIGRILGIVLSLLQIAGVALGVVWIVGWAIFVFGVVATSGG